MKIKMRSQILGLLILVTFLLFGCASKQVALKDRAELAITVAAKPMEYLIRQGDQLDIKFFYNPELNESVSVRPDGKISLQLVDEVQAAGLTPSQLDEVLTQKYANELKKPKITVIVRSFTGQRVYVGGEVGRPGLIDLSGGMTALEAVINAGGFKETAKPEAAILIRRGPDNKPIPIRIDLARMIDDEAAGPDVELQPYDIVYVPKTWIAKANKFVNQYIEQLLLFRGFSVGVGYGDIK